MSPPPPDAEHPPGAAAHAAPARRPGGAESANALPMGTWLGEFEVLAVVGEGGFGIVYRAWDHSLKRQVAVKEYMPASLAVRVDGVMVTVRSERHAETFQAGLSSFVKEAQMLAQFDHPALVKVYRFWKANGSAYMVMPYYEGHTLRDELRHRAEPPDETTLLGWLGPVADALAVIHAEHWYHRDIAPDNVMLLAGSARPLLLDFGAARRVIGDMTQALTVILKPGYAPVEQYAEIPGMKQGPWTDIYALAAVAHFAICGKTPPPSVGRLLSDNYEPLAELAAGRYTQRLLQAIDHALAVRPQGRTASVAQFKAESGLDELTPTAMNFPASHPGRTGHHVPATLLAEHPDATLRVAPLRVPAPAMATQAAASPQVAAVAPAVFAATAADATESAPGLAPGLAPASATARTAARAAAPRRLLLAGGLAAGFLLLAALWWSQRGQPATAPPAGSPPAGLTQAPAMPVPAITGKAQVLPPPALAAGAATPYDVLAQFKQIAQAHSAGWGLDVSLPSRRLRMDRDKLMFSLRSLQDGFVYVFYLGADGQLQQLFPNGVSPPPQVSKGKVLNLPQGRLDLNVAGPPGLSHLLVMVSRWPRDHATAAPREENGFRSFPVGSEGARLAAAHSAAAPGRLPLLAGVAVCGGAAPCDDLFGAAVLSFDVLP